MQHRKVPGIAHQRPSIAPMMQQPLQSPMGQPPQMPVVQDEPDLQSELAAEIYARLAVVHIGRSQDVDVEMLRSLAASARIAAEVFVAEFAGEQS